MNITRAQFKRVRHLLPLPRGGMRISHYRFLGALAYMASNGCKWRSLPACSLWPLAHGVHALSALGAQRPAR